MYTIRELLLVISFALSSTACTLSPVSTTIPEGSPQQIPTIAISTPIPTLATSTAIQVQDTPASTPIEEIVVPTKLDTSIADTIPENDCVSNIDLPSYIVQAGDTLAAIARESNSTVDDLVEFNCLTDANTIAVGQVLHVSRAITSASESNTTVVNKASTTGLLVIHPNIIGADGNLQLESNTSVIIEWQNIDRSNISQVEFTLRKSGSNELVSLGIDSNLSDGVAINWVVPPLTSGTVSASARLSGQGGNFISSMEINIVVADDPIVTEEPDASVSNFQIALFSASVESATHGDSITLTWETQEAETVSIREILESRRYGQWYGNQSNSGSLDIIISDHLDNPNYTNVMTYQLIATNNAGDELVHQLSISMEDE